MTTKLPENVDRHRERALSILTSPAETTATLLRGHLLIEELLESLIKKKCASPSVIDNSTFSFSVKCNIAKALYGSDFYVWPLIELLNSARNEMAHSIESPKLTTKLDKLTSSVDESIGPPTGLMGAISYLLGSLMCLVEITPQVSPEKNSLKGKGAK